MVKSSLLPLFAALAVWTAGAQSGWSQTPGAYQAGPSGDGRIQNVQPSMPAGSGSRALSPVNPYGWTSLDDQRKEQAPLPPRQIPPSPYPTPPREQGMFIPGGG